jgi:hypothetical protein
MGIVTWPLPTFGEVYARCKPKQKLTSPDTDPIVLDHPEGVCSVSCRILLFPRGISDSNGSPTLGGVLFKLVEGAPSAVLFTCALTITDGDETLHEFNDSGECVVDGDNQFSVPISVEFGHFSSLPDSASAAVTLKCWLKNDDLFGDVRLGFSSIATSMYGFVSQSPAAARPSTPEPTQDTSARQVSSLDDLVSVVLDTPEGWPDDEWAVLVHICAAVVATREVEDTSPQQATLSDSVRGDLFRLCPPLRTHFQELAHVPHQQGCLVRRLVGAMQTFSGLTAPRAKLEELHTLISEVGSTDELDEMEMLYRFVLDPSSITTGKVRDVILSDISEFKSDLVGMAEGLTLADRVSYASLLEDRMRTLEKRKEDALSANSALRARVGYIIEYAGWGATAVQALQSALTVPIVCPIDEPIRMCKSLLSLLSQ